ncbi:MAG: Uma2 family endonuclease [Pseudanabaena sp.]|jgi:Uma2 family endonuclease|uniref:Uma2 family endonuclease n=1 Tax=Cyanophyceae TaxID=3028117 RepID=UPI002577086C|nr:MULTISPECIES: Uma2 family endonuclease [Cyanophyceae]MCA6574338.1 Uma2 family endonuclease [Pseudanabaena sp. M53BS1SP1A06MG]MCA6583288.1 Uma2 family endonuclease [Pseudanabaena sp. M34BS1SP1A06MG]MCA6591062.1 Uma2 family endonuclease [Pseudanabaena sp. M38BS1SP1A06MG]MCA6601120.1 Uma2 family endonuclease [Pseudanabaena sp. M57BS1SP1A06MG]MCA6603798.1 Uma2 family endonuclease [Pseudanabaena sp. M007S1SP1A06QC]MCA6614566.1 Uma2 family endonuclease [Pseudanabaena sp. M090S1SP1A06QC]MCE29773
MTTSPIHTAPKIDYPDSDGQPMADNTQQFRWIVLIKENLELLFANDSKVFVAGDLLWYPVEGSPEIRVAPDVMVAFDRPKGDRGSYKQWLEGNIAPQVVFEILSPGNRLKEMTKKLQFYDRHGVEEYYIYDPESNDLHGLYRQDKRLNIIEDINNWTSPRLQIRFTLTEETLEIYRPDGQKFLTTLELSQRFEQEHQRAEQEYQRAERLLAQLKALGVEPN